MRFDLLCVTLFIAIVVGAQPSNILLICVDDLRPELKSFGASHMHTPNIDRLAQSGRAFHRHYVNAPTCGASRYTLLTGTYGPSNNQALFRRAEQMSKDPDAVTPSMPEWFRANGYTTVSVGKVSHHPGGWGGALWNDKSILEMPGAWDRQLMPIGDWISPRGAMHSLAHGEIRRGKTWTEFKMDTFQSAEGSDSIYHDGLIAEEGMTQLEALSVGEKPFFLAIGFIKPHLPFGSPRKYMEPYAEIELPPIPHPTKPDRKTTWHDSGEFFNQYSHGGADPRVDSEYADKVRRHYMACITYVDKLVGDLLAKLHELGQANNTIIILWGDHGWHLGEHAIWGKHALFEESLRSPLIISTPELKLPGKHTYAVVETVDIFPTLCDLAGLPLPKFAKGVSLKSQIIDPYAKGHEAYGYFRKAKTIRTSTHRLIYHQDGYIELYDHRSLEKETKNLAALDPQTTNRLLALLKERFPAESD